MNRRSFLAASIATVAMTESAVAPKAAKAVTPFSSSEVRALASTLASKPFQPPDTKLPKQLAQMGYDAYRGVRYVPEKALWRGEGLPFQLQFFHRGFLYSNRVDLYQVVDKRAEPISYSADMFTFDGEPPPAGVDLGFAGFRLHAPINRADYYDEVGVFLGASYFRAVAKGLGYGLSARGLAIRTGDARGEEFPYFKAFWIEKPAKGATALTVHALLDSQSAAAAFRFTIRPGETTVHDVEMFLYPRVDLDNFGVAPLTSMFLFDANQSSGFDDYRSAVHDSEGLAIASGRSGYVWRPLRNPTNLQFSLFGNPNPTGFGLLQRQRQFERYQDLESRFEARPSSWVEPIGNWGEGSVQLLEIPTKQEFHDNIVAFWRPAEKARAGSEHSFTYRLHWCANPPAKTPLAQAVRTGAGAASADARLFVIDFAGESLRGVDPNNVQAAIAADRGELTNQVVQTNPVTGGLRVSFQFRPGQETLAELSAQLRIDDQPVSERWLYQWSA